MKVWEKPGPENSEKTVEAAVERAAELGIKEIVVASATGKTAVMAMKAFKGSKVVVVTHHAGFAKPWQQEMKESVMDGLADHGAIIVTGTHALSGIERSFNSKFQGIYPTQIVAETLRLFGQGVKVCVEISVMAADAGELSGGPVIAIGGTGSGADTAAVLTPAHANRFLDLRVNEIICKPA
ncbi:MAG: pyruvate kinase alpha/beta domain-containing protein [Methanobacteriota archaeon]